MSAHEVAEHYNNVRQTGVEDRQKSKIFHLRNMNNWMKSQLINEAINLLNKDGVRHPRVLDIACGKGGDLRKWDNAKVKNIVMADVASVSVEQAKLRYQEMKHHRNQLFDVQFIVADCTKENLNELITDKEKFDLTSCQFAMHYAFVDEKSARRFLKNSVDSLKPGGIFIGTLPDADRIVWAVRNGENGKFANDVCKISYENIEELEEGKTPLFGAKFHFSLDSQVNCPEFLAYFPLVKCMLEELEMELLFVRNFSEAFSHWIKDEQKLLEKMKGLDSYPSSSTISKDSEYSEAKIKIDSLGDDETKIVGTMSKSEWEAVCMYLVFGFRKRDDIIPRKKMRKEEEQ